MGSEVVELYVSDLWLICMNWPGVFSVLDVHCVVPGYLLEWMNQSISGLCSGLGIAC